MASKNEGFTDRLLLALKAKGVDYKPNTRGKLKHFSKESGITYTTLHKCLREDKRGHVPEWDQLLKISIAVEKSIDWLLTGKHPPSSEVCIYWDGRDDLKELCDMARAVILSGTHWSGSLKENIKSFKIGLDNDSKITNLEQRMENIEKTTGAGVGGDMPK